MHHQYPSSTLTSEDKHIVKPTAKGASEERSNHRYPEIIIPSRPHLMPIPQKERHQSWSKVSCQVYRIASFPTETSADPEYHKEETEGSEVPCAEIAVVL